MKTKETTVSVSVPYKFADFMYGKVELGDTMTLDGGEDETVVRRARFCELRDEAKEMARMMTMGDEKSDKFAPAPAGYEGPSRRRRF
uniref:Uncharacterized protein n=1 Tax=viral metagenome TaxID=1070528 RepID=A0A6M3ILP6_9ZZZZ